MTTDLATLNSVNENASFWLAQEFAAWVEMLGSVADLDPTSTKFDDAKARFELAHSRGRKEMERLGSL